MQKKLLRRFADGWPDGKIAQELGVRESLIADQRRKIMETLRVSSHSQLVAMADRLARWRSWKSTGAA